MTPGQWQQVKALFHEAAELPAEDRNAFLATRCRGDAALECELKLLLESHDQAHDFVEQPALTRVSQFLTMSEGAPWKDTLIGQYRVLDELGRGGMGLVLLATRADDQFEQRVAIKVLRRGMDSQDILRRFRNERQILASLNHPNIANLHDGGTTADGQPYFVMEYVAGLPLMPYVDKHSLSVSERLELFRKICGAVQHAHQNLIIHRDLKPNNILVTEAGEVKLLDFGIAKLLSSDLRDGEMTETVASSRAMTPEYASPEQVLGQRVTTATDIYSLGVILYELLTGIRPYNVKGTSPAELSQAICNSMVTKPSEARTDLRDVHRTGSKDQKNGLLSQKSQAEQLKSLRGDVDNIVLMAMRREPERRYASVAQFSEDIRRHLEGLPVIARRDTLGYRTSKFVARHKVGVAAAALVVLALLAGVVMTAWQARVARAERDRARTEQAKAQRINAFLQDMLGAASPQVKGVDIKVVDILNDASKRARAEIANRPEVMTEVLTTLGVTYISLGRYQEAEADLRAGLEAGLKTNGEQHSATATTMGWLGLALGYENKVAEGEQISRRAVELQRRLHPEGHEGLGIALYSLGMNLIMKGDAKSAEPVLQEATTIIGRVLGERHGYHMATLALLGRAHEQLGNVESAESYYRKVIDLGAQTEARYRVYVAQASGFLGSLLLTKGSYAEAETNLRKSIDLYSELSVDSSVGVVKASLGLLYFRQGDYSRAEQEYREAVDNMRKFYPRDNPFPVSAAAGLGLCLTRTGKAKEGETYLREALQIRQRLLPAGDPLTFNTESALGECLATQKRYAEAEPLLLESYQGLKSRIGGEDWRTKDARARLLKLYEATRQPDKAADYR